MTRPALAIALALCALLAACGEKAPPPEPVRPVLTRTIGPGGAISRDVYPGEIRARHETDLGFRVGGKLVARLVDSGARVKRGEVLARLDPQDARLSEQAAAAQLDAARSDLALAQAERDRSADLLARHFISQSAFDARRNAYEAARARVEQASSQAAITANQSAYTTLAADADGIVIGVSAEPGQVVAAGQPVLRLAHAGEKEVVVSVPEGRLAQFTPGASATISLWADPATSFAGRVREVAGAADPVTRTYAVRVQALSPPEKAQIGMTASVLFASALDAGTVVLPLTALTREGDEPAVWVVDPATRRVRRRPVTVAQFREDGVAITRGLAAGDVVVTAGAHKLRPEQEVRVADAERR